MLASSLTTAVLHGNVIKTQRLLPTSNVYEGTSTVELWWILRSVRLTRDLAFLQIVLLTVTELANDVAS